MFVSAMAEGGQRPGRGGRRDFGEFGFQIERTSWGVAKVRNI